VVDVLFLKGANVTKYLGVCVCVGALTLCFNLLNIMKWSSPAFVRKKDEYRITEIMQFAYVGDKPFIMNLCEN
jgi:hypothetical protein